MATPVTPVQTGYFKIPNALFDLELATNELLVYTYFLSINRYKQNVLTQSIIVKYEHIAKVCNISVPTAYTIVKSLVARGLVNKINRYSQYDGSRRINCYTLNHINNVDNHRINTSYFKLYRHQFADIVKEGKSIFSIYLFIRRCHSKNSAFPSLTKCQNNCNIASRHLVVTSINKLHKLKFIKKTKRLSKKNNSYICNKYTLLNVTRATGHISRVIVLHILDDSYTSVIVIIIVLVIYLPVTSAYVCDYIKFP